MEIIINTMNRLFFLLAFSIFIFSCSEKKLDIKPKTYLSDEQQSKLKFDVIRYVDDMAKYATHLNKFDTIFNKEYLQKADKLDLLYAYKSSENDTLYFAVSKIAPSLKLKKVATVGKLVYDENQKISYYEESFRTWKMEIPELAKTTEMLFQKFIKNEDLSEFYTKNSKGKFIIEFPDDNNRFDTNSRQWIFSGNQDLLQQ